MGCFSCCGHDATLYAMFVDRAWTLQLKISAGTAAKKDPKTLATFVDASFHSITALHRESGVQIYQKCASFQPRKSYLDTDGS